MTPFLNKLSFFLVLLAFFFINEVNAQVKVGDNPTMINDGSVLEIESTDGGVLLPRIALTATDDATVLNGDTHLAGMIVYNTNSNTPVAAPETAVSPGFYYNDGNQWVRIASDGADPTTDAWVDNPTGSVVELGTLSDGVTPRDAATSLFYMRDDGKLIIGDPLSTGLNGESDNAGFVNIRRATGNTNLKLHSNDGIAIALMESFSNSANQSPVVRLQRGKGTDSDDQSTQIDVENDDVLGKIQFWGYNGNPSQSGRMDFSAIQEVRVDGVVNSGNTGGVPSKFVWKASDNSGEPFTDMMVLNKYGNLGVGVVTPLATVDAISNGSTATAGKFTANEVATDGNAFFDNTALNAIASPTANNSDFSIGSNYGAQLVASPAASFGFVQNTGLRVDASSAADGEFNFGADISANATGNLFDQNIGVIVRTSPDGNFSAENVGIVSQTIPFGAVRQNIGISVEVQPEGNVDQNNSGIRIRNNPADGITVGNSRGLDILMTNVGDYTSTGTIYGLRQDAEGSDTSLVKNYLKSNLGIGVEDAQRTLHISDVMRLEPISGSQPSSPALGDIYVDGDTNEICFYNGTVWAGLTGGICD